MADDDGRAPADSPAAMGDRASFSRIVAGMLADGYAEACSSSAYSLSSSWGMDESRRQSM
jgi:hypothetical protein